MSNERILVIGGAWYVGSHFARYALQHGLDVSIADNLSTGHRSSLKGSAFLHVDLTDSDALRQHLAQNRYAAIFHFAASCLVGESVERPDLYYRNNLIAAYNMLEAMRATGHDRVIFSSTCAVY